MIIDAQLKEFSRNRNAEIGCAFKQECKAAAWALSYDVEITDTTMQAAASIFLVTYVPQPTTTFCYIGYGQGDDNLYPIY